MRSPVIPETSRSQSSDLLRLVLQSAGIGAWTWDPRTNEVTDVGNCARLLGVERSRTADGRTAEGWFGAIHPEDRGSVEAAIAEARESGRLETEYRVVLSDGSIRRLRG